MQDPLVLLIQQKFWFFVETDNHLHKGVNAEIAQNVQVSILLLFWVLVLGSFFNDLFLLAFWKFEHDQETVGQVLDSVPSVPVDSAVDDLGNLIDKGESVTLEGFRDFYKILYFADSINAEAFPFCWEVTGGCDIIGLEQLIVDEVHADSAEDGAHEASNFNYGLLHNQSFVPCLLEVVVFVLVFLELLIGVDDDFEHFFDWGDNEFGDVGVEGLQEIDDGEADENDFSYREPWVNLIEPLVWQHDRHRVKKLGAIFRHHKILIERQIGSEFLDFEDIDISLR